MGARERDVRETVTCRRRWGPACAFLDYDNDGWMDIFSSTAAPRDFFTPKAPLRNALYRNNRDGTFTDVTEKAGVAGGTFGMGVAVGDYDNDGYPDLLVTAYGRCILYRNNGNGTFTDVTDEGRAWPRPGWTTSAVWFDYDNDGRLDLFVCSFVEFGAAKNVVCGDNKLGRRYYCIPRVFKPTAEPPLPQQRRRHVHRGLEGHGHRAAPWARPWAWSRPTSTTTAAWTCSWPTTPCRTSSS